MNVTVIDTEYMLGEEYQIGYDPEVWENNEPYERDDWARTWLKSEGIKPKKNVHLNLKYKCGNIIGMTIFSYNYKKKI